MLDICAKKIIDLYYTDYRIFFAKANVVGIGYGYKVIKGIKTYEPCIQVFVEKKIAPNCLKAGEVIPSLYKGVKTDVIETGKFITKNKSSISNKPPLGVNAVYSGKVRPIQPGWSMSIDFEHYPGGNEVTGTLSYMVTDKKQVSETYCLLSVNGTFADWNNYPEGAPILQPSYEYGGFNPQDVVGTLLRYEPLRFSLEGSPAPPLSEMNVIDASVASFVVNPQIELINPFIPPNNVFPVSVIEPSVGLDVNWTGYFSGGQEGSVFDGDYGALVYNKVKTTANVVGLLFSKNYLNGRGAICKMSSIENILDVNLVL